jgi:hypothetical protein
MADFPELGKTYKSLDNEEYQSIHRREGVGKLLKSFLVLCIIALICIQTYQIIDLQTRVRHLEFKLSTKIEMELKSIQNTNEKQDSRLRTTSTDIDLLYKIIEGKDPYNTEEE